MTPSASFPIDLIDPRQGAAAQHRGKPNAFAGIWRYAPEASSQIIRDVPVLGAPVAVEDLLVRRLNNFLRGKAIVVT